MALSAPAAPAISLLSSHPPLARSAASSESSAPFSPPRSRPSPGPVASRPPEIVPFTPRHARRIHLRLAATRDDSNVSTRDAPVRRPRLAAQTHPSNRVSPAHTILSIL